MVSRSGNEKSYDISGLILETKPPGVVLVLSNVNVRSVDPISPLKIQNSNAFNDFLPLLGAFGLCSH